MIVRCSDRNGDIVARLSPAHLHRSPGKAGTDGGEVFTLDLDLRFRSGVFSRSFTRMPTRLGGGSITIADERFENVVPYPLDVVAPVTARLIDDHGREIKITAHGISLIEASREAYLEPFPGRDASE